MAGQVGAAGKGLAGVVEDLVNSRKKLASHLVLFAPHFLPPFAVRPSHKKTY